MTRFRHVAAFVLLGLCFAVVALWWRSYVVYDMVQGSAFAQSGVLASIEGVVMVQLVDASDPVFLAPWSIHSSSADGIRRRIERGASTTDDDPAVWGFVVHVEPRAWLLQAPHWFFALITLAAACAVRPEPRFQFSLRQTMVAITLAAVVFGLILGTIPRS